MKTSFLQSSQIALAIALLKSGQNIAIPTETVYGLAADAAQPKAIEGIFKAKGRPRSNPLILHIASNETLSKVAREVPDYAITLAKVFWPGPLTLVLPKKRVISDLVTAGQETVAVRLPNHEVAQKIISAFNLGIVAPSANQYMHTSPTTAEHVMASLKGKIAAVIDGGACQVGLESTIVDCTSERPSILRKGMITGEQINSVIAPLKVFEKPSANIRVPGQHKKHYSPKTPLQLVDSEKLMAQVENLMQTGVSFCGFGLTALPGISSWLQMPDDPKHYAQLLYDVMHRMDGFTQERMLVELPPNTVLWEGIHDRLARASSKCD